MEFGGTVLLVSHDRALLRELSNRVWAYEGDRIVDYGGTFVEWEAMKKDAALEWVRSLRLPVMTQSGGLAWIREPAIVQAQHDARLDDDLDRSLVTFDDQTRWPDTAS